MLLRSSFALFKCCCWFSRLFSFSIVAWATKSLSIGIWDRVEIVIFTTWTGNVIWIRAYDSAALTLKKLAHINPNLLSLVFLAKITIMHIRLVASNRVWHFRCLCLGAYGQLCSETSITTRDIWIGFHSRFNEFKAGRTLVWNQGWAYWLHTFTLGASHFAFLLEDIKCL